MICERCGCAIEEGENFEWYGKQLCEDCYIGALQPPRPCDPAAVSSAKATRSQLGQRGTDGLTPLQKQIYALIKEKGKITREELARSFELPPWELEKQFAVLRHCELVKGFKEGQTVYLTLMSTEDAAN
ncbi:winged helix-turn-helix domain-containing protein [Desulfoscipio geothermicus]|uniref:Winged helix-turn-helix DNA-binding n=1 Tax=Desulfoscipio geothermicus DSM 3669 TaxID=1121426 RepID=A0A1I6DJE5_9FIRM|nr:winged helix-turn-helix domain-containing protein [Desulfoscipio geothermicus]SFR05556.1 hypothetical protein SAMN05660706_11247 [Desulfoscipio geothermicus DSM 3669]